MERYDVRHQNRISLSLSLSLSLFVDGNGEA